MRTNTAVRRADTNTPGVVHKAEIMSNAAMYDIFYNKIYTRKEMAIVRELLANAWDAMAIARNTDTPIDIHLPTLLEPWFEIRDYGTGMHPDDLIWRYMNYGNSDKNETNDSIGGFGFGGKAPFCYTDSFSVISYYKGTKYVSQAFIQEDGTPGCTLMHEEPTDEPDGMQLQVNIKDTGPTHNKFIEAMRELYPHIPTAPKLNVSAERHNFIRHEYLLDLDVTDGGPLKNVKVRQGGNLYNSTGAVRLIMGIIPYTLELDEISAAYRAYDLDTTPLQQLRRLSFDLTVDIGTAEVTASREGLEQNANTRGGVVAVLPKALALAQKEFEKQIANAKTWFDWHVAHNALPIRVTAPDWVVDATELGDSRVKASELGTDKKISENCMIVKKTRDLADGFRRTYQDTIQARTFNESIVYVQPKNRWPIKRFLTEKHFTADQDKDAVVIYGDVAKVRAAFKKLGIPNTVHEMEYLKAPRGSSQAQRKKLGATLYSISTHRIGTPTTPNPRNLRSKNIADFMEEADDTETLIIINCNYSWAAIELFDKGLITTDFEEIDFISISANHTRVIKSLKNEYSDRVIDMTNKASLLSAPSLVSLNEERMMDLVDQRKCRELLYNNFLHFQTDPARIEQVFGDVHLRNRSVIGVIGRQLLRAYKLCDPKSYGFGNTTYDAVVTAGLVSDMTSRYARKIAQKRANNLRINLKANFVLLDEIYDGLNKEVSGIFLAHNHNRYWGAVHASELQRKLLAALSARLPRHDSN